MIGQSKHSFGQVTTEILAFSYVFLTYSINKLEKCPHKRSIKPTTRAFSLSISLEVLLFR